MCFHCGKCKARSPALERLHLGRVSEKLSHIAVAGDEVFRLGKLKTRKLPGGLHPRILKEPTKEILELQTSICNLLLKLAPVLDDLENSKFHSRF